MSASNLATEALVMRAPVVALQSAKNQSSFARQLSEMGIPVYQNAAKAAGALIRGRASIGQAALRVDSFGARRVVEEMERRIGWRGHDVQPGTRDDGGG